MSDRQVIVVDVESDGLRPGANILEVAAVNLRTNEELRFVPYVPMSALAMAEPKALQINRYFERGIRDEMLSPENTGRKYFELRTWLTGNTLAGCNPAFDARLLSAAQFYDPSAYRAFGSPIRYSNFGEVHHHRLADLSAYAAGALGLSPGDLPGLAKVCELLFVEIDGEHSALGDARAAAACFHRLMAMHLASEAFSRDPHRTGGITGWSP